MIVEIPCALNSLAVSAARRWFSQRSLAGETEIAVHAEAQHLAVEHVNRLRLASNSAFSTRVGDGRLARARQPRDPQRERLAGAGDAVLALDLAACSRGGRCSPASARASWRRASDSSALRRSTIMPAAIVAFVMRSTRMNDPVARFLPNTESAASGRLHSTRTRPISFSSRRVRLARGAGRSTLMR